MSKAAHNPATDGLSEEEENQLWEKSIQTWKQQKEERRKKNEELIAKGEKPIDYDNDWKDLPIFMNDLKEGDNEHVAALQAITDESTPDEIAENYKELGNDYFRAGKARYKEALHYYNKALSVKCDDLKKNSAYLTNRAAVNLELGNYRNVIQDCTIAIEFNPLNIKGYFRMAKAFIALSKFKEAIETCDKGIEQDPESKDLPTLKQTAQKKIDDIKRREQEKIDRETKKEQELNALATKLYEKNKYKLGHPIMDLSQYTYQSDRKISFDENGDVHFPVVFLYPEFGKSDFIMDFQEDHTFGDHLSMMFPPENPEFPPWDSKKEYSVDNIEVYFETNYTKPILPNIKTKEEKRWIRIKHTTAIAAVLAHAEYIIPQLPLFYVVAKGNLFYKKFLEKQIK
ncbi:hypothetical protein DICPUDRAFT_38478 [Dictyostelium purpureum]|uniref:Cns1/TTC4 wheel domain-containing protein n=1 Tax=Dictyostelium purpureum TaxID=5786 RepID=F0ZUI9_DICPU|nr:uncharacterized protein DICPUDRAFT_38478 [Dictyostelium purpureum]EGC32391.1 hypothetical protein DICPUDRAFT_38478 [Dictyostelium purpureum]|eukprot:XP_003291077.1 hypothetical protein DICPUDRAFT_38478 [Dictyostelium purpureum]